MPRKKKQKVSEFETRLIKSAKQAVAIAQGKKKPAKSYKLPLTNKNK